MKSLLVVVALTAIALASPSSSCIAELYDSSVMFSSPLDAYYYSDFNFISFTSFEAKSGDVEGRLAAGGDFTANAFSVGEKLQTGGASPADNPRPYSAAIGGNAVVTGGRAYHEPATFSGICTDNTQSCVPDGPFNWVGPTAGISAAIAGAKGHFESLADDFFAQPSNTIKTPLSSGWVIDPASPSSSPQRYFVDFDASEWSSSHYEVVNLPAGSEIVVRIHTNGDGNQILFQGGTFGGQGGLNVFVIRGNQDIMIEGNLINGHVLAPGSSWHQWGGVAVGNVIVNEAPEFLQVNKPSCSVNCPCCADCP